MRYTGLTHTTYTRHIIVHYVSAGKICLSLRQKLVSQTEAEGYNLPMSKSTYIELNVAQNFQPQIVS